MRAFEDPHEDYLLVADATYIREGRTHERTHGGEMKDCLNEIVYENCMFTLSEINQELRQDFQLSHLYMA